MRIVLLVPKLWKKGGKNLHIFVDHLKEVLHITEMSLCFGCYPENITHKKLTLIVLKFIE